ncbi:MAG: radical SAM protein [Lentisphaerota bacterium]
MNTSAESLIFSVGIDQYSLQRANISDLRKLYTPIFGGELADDEITSKSSCNDFVILVLSNSLGGKIGISVLRYFAQDVSLWLFGIIPEVRRKGLGQALLKQTEKIVLAGGNSKLRFSTYNTRKEMLLLAIKNNYRIVATDKGIYGDGLKIRLEKPLCASKCKINSGQPNKREVRFLLSVKCNYRCFFCHMEGLNQENNYEGADPEEFINVLSHVSSCGYNDVTFTGGEPAISKKLLLKAIAFCNSLEPPPALTIVTNGALWDETLIKAVSLYSGNLKINFSVHSLNQAKYDIITGTSGCYDNALGSLRSLIAAGVKVKLNCVILKNLNDSYEDLINYIRTAHSIGVFSVKFLELLITGESAGNFKYFTSVESIAIVLLSAGFHEVKKSDRARYFNHQDYPGIEIEAVQCTCKLGCAKCNSVRDRTFGPDAHYYPCFVQSQEGLSPGNFKGIESLFAAGDKIINEYALKYGSDSPILIAQDKFLKTREEVFFETCLNFDDCSKILINSGFKLVKIRTFKLFYCAPLNQSDDWKEFRKILKFGYDGHTTNKIDFIFSQHRYQKKDGFLLSAQKFLDKSPPPSCESVEKAKMIMSALDFEIYLEKDFEVHDFAYGEFRLSLDKSSKYVNFKLHYSEISNNVILNITEQLKSVPIMIPFTKWLMTT